MADKLMTDEAVIKMLQDEARTASKNFASEGLGAYLPRRPTTQAPKPNTRFLRNILRETDSHNQALLAKEAEEAQARLKALKRSKEGKDHDRERTARRSHRRAEDEDERHRVKRRRVDVMARDRNRLSPPKESRRYESQNEEDRSRSRSRTRTRRKSRSRSRSRDTRRRRRHYDGTDSENGDYHDRRSSKKDRKGRRDDRNHDMKEHSRSSHHKSSTTHRRSRTRSISGDELDSDENRHRHTSSRHSSRRQAYGLGEEPRRRSRDRRKRHKSRSRSPSTENSEDRDKGASRRRKRRRSPSSGSDRRRSRSPRRNWTRDDKPRNITNGHKKFGAPELIPRMTMNGAKRKRDTGADSDPLEDIVGPLPPPLPPKVKVRGRGAALGGGMDSRFAADYDPSTDVTLDLDDDDDWGQALEALQARAKFKQSQGDRLRAAGFTDDEIKSWEKGDEKNEDDVRWSKMGEGREWDRGKVVNDEGAVEVESDFGRLKGT